MIDARGLSCPEPVIMIKKAMKSAEAEYAIMVDNRTSVENVTRFAEHSGYTVDLEQNGDEFTLKIHK